MASRPKRSSDEKEEKDGKDPEVIVIDIGSRSVKIGWAGEDQPRAVIPAVVVDQHNQSFPASVIESATEFAGEGYIVGHDALKIMRKSPTRIEAIYPIQQGEVKDWDAMEKLWDYAFKHELEVDPSLYPVLITCPVLCSRAYRDNIAQRMFKLFKVPSLVMANQAVLSLFASGRTTGIVLEIGDGATHAVPVFEGFALRHAVIKSHVAGSAVTECLARCLAARGVNFTENATDMVRDIKEKLCAVSPTLLDARTLQSAFSPPRPPPTSSSSSAAAASRSSSSSSSSEPDDSSAYELPDGSIIHIDEATRLSAAEVLFQPALLGPHQPADSNEIEALPLMLMESLSKCDAFLRKDLYKNILLAGGTSMLRGFGERMKADVVALKGDSDGLNLVLDSQRRHAAWIGGSMFASLPTFHQLEISNKEYRAGDPDIIHKTYF